MHDDMTSIDARTLAPSRLGLPRSVVDALRACRDITVRQWAFATGIALILLLSHFIGLLPPLLRLVPNLVGPLPPAWTALQSVGSMIAWLGAAYCFLLAVSVAEAGPRRSPIALRRYVFAGIAACAGTVVVEIALYTLAPSLAPRTAGWSPLDVRKLLGSIVWSTANICLSGGLVLAVYVRFKSARFARGALNSAELERAAAAREVLACRLASMQARIEPQFLIGTLTQVEALYERDSKAGDRMLDALIDYLHAALPQLRTEHSTLGQETQLVESYLRIVQIRMGSRLDYSVDVGADLANCSFPPMLLLPIVDDALRLGLEPLAFGGEIRLSATAAEDRLRVSIADNGMPQSARCFEDASVSTLRDRLEGLYGPTARLVLATNEPHGVVTTIEVPHECARDHC